MGETPRIELRQRGVVARVIGVQVAVLGSLLIVGLCLVASPGELLRVAQPPQAEPSVLPAALVTRESSDRALSEASSSASSVGSSSSGSSSSGVDSGGGSGSGAGNHDPFHHLPVALFGLISTLALGALIKQLFTGIPIPYTAILLGVGMLLGGFLLLLDDQLSSWSDDIRILQRVRSLPTPPSPPAPPPSARRTRRMRPAHLSTWACPALSLRRPS